MINNNTTPLPQGPFRVIYADPPWKYSSGGARGGRYGKLDYNVMTVDEMKALPVSTVAMPDAALFMWTTNSFLVEALELGAAWGFNFIRIDKIWKKMKKTGGRHGVVGPWGMTDSELQLLFGRGKICGMQKERNQFTVVEAPYTGLHSQKPSIFRELIDRRFGDVPRLEMFARGRFDGWTVWGDQANA